MGNRHAKDNIPHELWDKNFPVDYFLFGFKVCGWISTVNSMCLILILWTMCPWVFHNLQIIIICRLNFSLSQFCHFLCSNFISLLILETLWAKILWLYTDLQRTWSTKLHQSNVSYCTTQPVQVTTGTSNHFKQNLWHHCSNKLSFSI